MLQKIRAHKNGIGGRKQNVSKWKVPKVVKAEVLRFVDELDLGKVNRGRRISEGRQAKYLDLLRIPLEYFNKPTDKVGNNDVEAFERALAKDQIQSRQKLQPYAHSTKVDMRKALKIYFRWRLGESAAVDLTGWLDTRQRPKTPEYLTEAEAEKLLRGCRTAEQRFIIALLFDSGARAEEFINIRYEDIHLPNGKDNFAKLALKQEYSKTLGRTISLYWRHSLDAIKDYLQERISQGIRPGDPVYANTYGAMRMFLLRIGSNVLKKSVHPHLFRHSSATFYATKLNRQELCYRYGWKFSSNMPDIYISRAGMENRELDQKFTTSELGTLKDELARLHQEQQIKDDRIMKMEHSLEVMQRHFPTIAEILAKKPTIQEVEMALRKKRAMP